MILILILFLNRILIVTKILQGDTMLMLKKKI